MGTYSKLFCPFLRTYLRFYHGLGPSETHRVSEQRQGPWSGTSGADSHHGSKYHATAAHVHPPYEPKTSAGDEKRATWKSSSSKRSKEISLPATVYWFTLLQGKYKVLLLVGRSDHARTECFQSLTRRTLFLLHTLCTLESWEKTSSKSKGQRRISVEFAKHIAIRPKNRNVKWTQNIKNIEWRLLQWELAAQRSK